MDKDIKKSYKLTMLVAILCLVVIVGSTTYAYFKTRIKGNGTKLNVNAKKFVINIEESDMTLTSLVPIYDTDKETKANSKTFTTSINNSLGITNISSGCFNTYLVIDEIGKNLISRYLKYELVLNENNDVISSGDFSNASNQSEIKLIKNTNLNDFNNTYTLRIWLSYSEVEDQSSLLTGSVADRTLKIHVKVTGYTGICKTYLADQILEDNPTVLEIPESYDEALEGILDDTTGTIFKTNKTEDGSIVYYYAGNTTNNWVNFAGDYWRIIRTNEDGSIRLLYVGSDTTKIDNIGLSDFNSSDSDPMYVGYMYGTSGSLASNRLNTTDSDVKIYVDDWYELNLLGTYDKYISKSSIYCNDRSIENGEFDSQFYFGPLIRLYNSETLNKTPSYKCGANTTGGLFETTQAIADKFSASTTGGGNGQLKYPIALMTADEIAFAAGMTSRENGKFLIYTTFAWFFTTSEGEDNVFESFLLLTPSNYSDNDGAMMIIGIEYGDILNSVNVKGGYNIRPVISLDKCVLYASGDGTADNPYVIDYDNSCN